MRKRVNKRIFCIFVVSKSFDHKGYSDMDNTEKTCKYKTKKTIKTGK